jgi:dihydroorotate dehydrogenase
MYKILRTILFYFNPEWVHYFSMNGLKLLCKLPLGKAVLASLFKVSGIQLNTQFIGIHFPNPIGLGAGFDKNARYLNELEALGFGFVEIGTVTPIAQVGNEKPRLFRLPKDKALINRMGFNNDGVEIIQDRLKKWNSRVQKTSNSPFNQRLIVGGNIGKNKMTPNEDAWKDYVICFNALHELVDYFVVNVSSPNTPGLRELQEKESLRKILTELQNQNSKYKTQKPILLKIAPDLSLDQIDDVISLAMEIKLDGLVASNTTIDRKNLLSPETVLESIGAGGLSGKPLQKRSTEIIQYIHEKTDGQLPIIASGGIFTGSDAQEKLSAGASLVQVWTGFVYEGPSIVKNIAAQLKKN